jgi:hypothetical protein
MHHILLIFFLFLIFCGPLAVIRTALGCGTLKTAPRAEPVLINHPAQDPMLEPPQAARRTVLVRLTNEHTGVRVMRGELVKLPFGGNQ